MIIFDGSALAQAKEQILRKQVSELAQTGQRIVIVAILFTEDAGSRLYTRLKKEASERVGIEYQTYEHSLTEPVSQICADIHAANEADTVTGIIIQKPTRKIWEAAQTTTKIPHHTAAQLLETHSFAQTHTEFNAWWQSLTSQIAPTKDVDGLHPDTLEKINQGTWEEAGRVLPATCQAVLTILEQAPLELQQAKVKIIGKSDLLGTPLLYVLKNRGVAVELLRRADLADRMANGQKLLDADVIVSATGAEKLITGDMVTEGVVLVDVGEPRPDIDQASVAARAAFVTPVPGGVGPLTVICLLENAVKLAATS